MIFLLFLIIIPCLAALGSMLGLGSSRKLCQVAAILNLLLSLVVFFLYRSDLHAHSAGLLGTNNPQFPQFAFVGGWPVVPVLDLKFLLGIDGLSMMMVLLSTLVTTSAVWATPKNIPNPGAFYSCLMLISAGILGAFLSLDLFFFYAFHELALIPTFLLIGIWGNGDRQAAAWKITIYLAFGSFILLVGLIALYLSVPAGLRTFDIRGLYEVARAGQISLVSQRWTFLLLLIGFGILVSLFPFHTWAPSAYSAAPTPATMLHAGVLKKFGLYGLLRIALPLLPEGARMWVHLLLILLIGNILFVGFVTIAQKRLDNMLGYSSVMHMGYIFLGIASLNSIGLSGAALLMFAHGLSIAVLFAIAGDIRQRYGTMRMSELGGIAVAAPLLATLFGFAMFASIGLPGFANFASEVLVFFGSFDRLFPTHFSFIQIAVVCALWGVVMSAVYMLRAYRNVFQGMPAKDLAQRQTQSVPMQSVLLEPLSRGARWPLILLVVCLIAVGFFPQTTLLKVVSPSILNAMTITRTIPKPAPYPISHSATTASIPVSNH